MTVEAVRHVIERGYRVAKVAERLGISVNRLHKWVKAAKPDEPAAEPDDAKREILGLRGALRCVEEERDISKKAARYFASRPE